MDTARDQFTAARVAMRDAFAQMSDLARRAGADADRITELHGRFFDGNVDIKRVWRRVLLLAELRRR